MQDISVTPGVRCLEWLNDSGTISTHTYNAFGDYYRGILYTFIYNGDGYMFDSVKWRLYVLLANNPSKLLLVSERGDLKVAPLILTYSKRSARVINRCMFHIPCSRGHVLLKMRVGMGVRSWRAKVAAISTIQPSNKPVVYGHPDGVTIQNNTGIGDFHSVDAPMTYTDIRCDNMLFAKRDGGPMKIVLYNIRLRKSVWTYTSDYMPRDAQKITFITDNVICMHVVKYDDNATTIAYIMINIDDNTVYSTNTRPP